MDPYLLLVIALSLFGTLRVYRLRQEGYPITLGNIFWVGPFYRAFQVAGILFTVTGFLGLLIAGVCLSISTKTNGTVLHSERMGQSSFFPARSTMTQRGSYDWPVISFQVGTLTHQFHSFLTWRGHYRDGQTVTVLYVRQHPDHAWLWSTIVATPIEVFLAGLLLFWIGKEGEDHDINYVKWS